MAITPAPGWKIDPNNPNAVVPINEPPPQPASASMGFRYTDPRTGGSVFYNDPVINATDIKSKGLTYSEGQQTPDPLASLPGYRYTAPSGSAAGELGAIFAPGGIYGNRNVPTADDEARTREQERQRVQAQIDAIEAVSAEEMTAARQRAEQLSGQNRARLSATGQLGSGSETSSVGELDRRRVEEEDLIRKSKLAKISEVLTGVENRSREIIDKQKTSARENTAAYLDYLTAASEQARADMTALATAGADLSQVQKQKLLEQTGYDGETFDALYKSIKIANGPADEYINKDKPEIIGGKAVFFRKVVNADGTFTLKTESLDLPEGATTKKVKQTVNTAEGVMVLYEDGTFERIGGVYSKPTTGTTNQFGGAKLSSSQRDDIATMDTVKGLAQKLISLDAIKGGLPGSGAAGYGTIATYLSNVGIGSSEGQHVRDLIGEIKGTIAKLRGGTSFTPNEQALLDTYTPTIDDADWKVVQKLRDLVNSINTKKKNLIETSGGSWSAVDEGGAPAADTGGEDAGAGMVRMTGPGGEFDVPADQVQNFKDNGYNEL